MTGQEEPRVGVGDTKGFAVLVPVSSLANNECDLLLNFAISLWNMSTNTGFKKLIYKGFLVSPLYSERSWGDWSVPWVDGGHMMVIHVIDNLWVTDRLFLSENGFLKLSCGHLLGWGDMGWRVSVKVLVGGVDHTLVCVFDALLSFAYTSCGNYLDMVTCLDRGISDLVKQWSKCCWEGNF